MRFRNELPTFIQSGAYYYFTSVLPKANLAVLASENKLEKPLFLRWKW